MPTVEEMRAALKAQGPSIDEMRAALKSEPQQSTGEQIARTAIDSLPMVGMVAGGTIGGMSSGGLAAIPAAAVGSMAGESLKRGLKQLFFDENQGGVSDILKSQAMAGLEGAAGEMGGQIIGKALSAIPAASKSVGKTLKGLSTEIEKPPVANLQEIMKASANIGVKPIEAMKTSNKLFQELESGLSQSGSFPAAKTKADYDQFFKGMEEAGNKIADLKTPNSPFNIGKDLGQGIKSEISASREPVSEMYNVLQDELRLVPVDSSSVTKQVGALKRNPIFKTKDGQEFLQKYSDDLLSSSKTLADLKEFRTNLMGSLPKTASDLDKARLDNFYEAVTKIRDNSISAAASSPELKAAGKGAQKEAVSLMDDISLADSAHGSLMNDINSLKELVGAKKEFSSPNQFLNHIDSMSEEDLAKRASNLSVDTMQTLKSKYPSFFDKVKEANVNEMVSSATDASGFNTARFIKNYDRLGEETKNLLFDPDTIKQIESFRTVKNAIPDQLGPSGTPKGQMMMDRFSPKRNLKDYLINKSLNSGEAGSKIVGAAGDLANSASDVANQAIQATQRPAGRAAISWTILESAPTKTILPKAADSNQDNSAQLKGPEKWIAEGSKNVMKLDSRIDQTVIDKAKSSAAGKELLQEAQSASPKRLQSIAEEIKKQFAPKQSAYEFPMTVKRKGMVATVFNDQDLAEAKSEGWQ